MLDQRRKYAPRGLASEFVGEGQTDPGILQKVQEGKFQLVSLPIHRRGDSYGRQVKNKSSVYVAILIENNGRGYY